MRRIEPYFRSKTYGSLLDYLENKKMSSRDLEDFTGKLQSVIHRQLKLLIKDGLVYKHKYTNRFNKKIYSLTAKGRRILFLRRSYIYEKMRYMNFLNGTEILYKRIMEGTK